MPAALSANNKGTGQDSISISHNRGAKPPQTHQTHVVGPGASQHRAARPTRRYRRHGAAVLHCHWTQRSSGTVPTTTPSPGSNNNHMSGGPGPPTATIGRLALRKHTATRQMAAAAAGFTPPRAQGPGAAAARMVATALQAERRQLLDTAKSWHENLQAAAASSCHTSCGARQQAQPPIEL